MTPMTAARDYLVRIDLDPELDRDAWARSRLAGIGGSDAAAIVGESQKSAVTVWHERVTGETSFVDNERTITGRLLEGPVLDMFADGDPAWPRRGGPLSVVKPPSVYHRDRPWQRGSVDGLVYEPDAVKAWQLARPGVLIVDSPVVPLAGVEVKTHGWFGASAYGDSDDDAVISVPPDKRIQCAWYMELYDLDVWYLAALVDTHIRRTFVLHRDREIGATLLEEVDLFWRRHILTGDPPPPDGSKDYRDHLRKKYADHSDLIVPAGPDVDAAVVELIALKRRQKLDTAKREALEQTVKAAIGANMGLQTSLGRVTWKSQATGKLREREARDELYRVCGWTDAEISDFEERYKQPDHRVMRTPK